MVTFALNIGRDIGGREKTQLINLPRTGEEFQPCSYTTATSPADSCRLPQSLEAHLQAYNVGAYIDVHVGGADDNWVVGTVVAADNHAKVHMPMSSVP